MTDVSNRKQEYRILIESQWNLNVNHVAPSAPLAPDINRITVEFKLTAILFKFN